MDYNQRIKKLIPYTDLDYDAIMTSMIDSIPELTPEYNDYSESDFGMVLIELFAKAFDILSWKVDVAMNEALPFNSVSLKAALKQSRWLGYKAKQNQASKSTFEFTFINDGFTVVIPSKTKISTDIDSEGDGLVS